MIRAKARAPALHYCASVPTKAAGEGRRVWLPKTGVNFTSDVGMCGLCDEADDMIVQGGGMIRLLPPVKIGAHELDTRDIYGFNLTNLHLQRRMLKTTFQIPPPQAF